MYIDHSLMMYLLDLTEKLDEKVDMGVLKKAMKARGVNQRGWRLYANYGDRLFMPVLKRATRNFAAQAIAWIRVLQACEMDVPPPLHLCKAVTSWPLSGATTADIPPLFLKAVWKAAVCKEYLEDEVQIFLQEEVAFVATWYFSQGGKELLSDAQLKAGWEAIWKIYEEDLRKPQNSQRASWNSWVNRVEYDGYVFEALTSATALYLEGREMQHCIASYTHECRLGMHRVYAVTEKRTGARAATITVGLNTANVWEVDEVHGAKNDEV
ncbi:MAG TPA: hypothetical protein EYP19_03615, partial [Desulfobacterales bacterium]|nr:hypothetical protein [Desulfobacterales bacterium]